MNDDVKYAISISQIPLQGKIKPGDPVWPKFTSSFKNQILSPAEITTAICEGHAYTCWLDGPRKKENFWQAQHIALDFDSCDINSSLPFLESLAFVQLYGGLLHTTPSHTDEHPKCRLIFFLDETVFEIARYEAMVKFLIQMFSTDQSCKDATRFFYGNRGANIVPLFKELPISHLRVLYARYSKLLPEKAPVVPEQREIVSDGFVENKIFQQTPLDADRIEKALSCLPNHLGAYDRWLSVLMAVHSEMGDDGIALCDRYIPGYPGEVAQKFASFKGEKGTGIGTLFHIAKEYGWDHRGASQQLKH